MNHEIDKVMKMVGELGSYLLRAFGAETLSVTVKRTGNGFSVGMECPVRAADRDKIETVRRGLSQPRKPELEDYYWQLAGDPLNPNALAMVSIMCDSIAIEHRDGNLFLELIRLSGP